MISRAHLLRDCHRSVFIVIMIVLFVEQATYPALRREYIFDFDRADVPDRIQYDVLSGTHAIENHPSDMTTNGPRLSIIDKSSRVPMSLRIKWEWDED